MDELVLEEDASRVLVDIGRTVELWILENAKQQVEGRVENGSESPRIGAAEIRKSLAEFMDHGIAVLHEVRDATTVSSRRAG